MTSTTKPQTDADLVREPRVDPAHFQRVSILDPILQETYTAYLAKETLGWRGWIPQLPEVECKAKTKKELLNTLAIRLREALQAREDAWDEQLEADVAAGKLEHLRADALRAKKAGTLIDL